MNKKDIYLEYRLKFYFELKKYLETELDRENYFYFINLENYYLLEEEFDFLDINEKNFLEIYFDQNMKISKKLNLLNLKTNNEYYNYYRRTIKNIREKDQLDGSI